MNDKIRVIENYLEISYSGAKMMDDVESMHRIARALAALKADTEMEIFTEEFQELYLTLE